MSVPERLSSWALLVQAAIIVGLIWTAAWFGRDEFQAEDDDDVIATPPATVVGDRVVVAVDAQRAAGILVQSPAPAEYRAAQRHFGVVADPRSLVEARQRHLSLTAQMAAADAMLVQRRADLARIQALYDEGRNATLRELELAQAAVASEEQRLAALSAERRAVADGLRVVWGDAFAGQPGDAGTLLARAATREVELVLFVLPPGVVPRDTEWRVNVVGTESPGVVARLVGRSPQAVPGLQGDAWMLAAPPGGLPAGARVRVLADSNRGIQGVQVPPAAIVRFGGKAWVYVRVAPDQFQRRPLDTARPLGDGLFTDALTVDAEVVTSGAQLLLSEEFKFQIKNENTD